MEDHHKKLILKIIPAGNLVGLTSLSESNNLFPYTAQAYQDSLVRLIDIKVFRRLILENGEFATQIVNLLSDDSLQINSRFFCLTNKQSYGRLADILLCLSQQIFKSEKFDLNLSRRELAELAGMSTESVIRILKRFQDDGIIKMNGKLFEIPDYEALYRISDTG